MSETKELMQSTLPKGWEIVEDREYQGKSGDLQGELSSPNLFPVIGQYRWSDAGWEKGYRYACKIKVTWTAEVPTEPDYYWHKHQDYKGKPRLCMVANEDETVAYFIGDELSYDVQELGGEWLRFPIQPPIEGE